ncbi:MAG: WG repeat-containing protein [Clostridia bacterium]|nr:WG repeat-containing protein [Clostridia bacterium]
MTLIDEHELAYQHDKKRKIIKLLIKILIVLIILGIILVVYLKTKESKKLKFSIDGILQTNIEDSLVLKDEKGKIIEENGQIYFSVQQLSTLLNYQYYNSEYKKKGEDKTKCHIKIENEYTSYISGSNKIYKSIINKKSEKNNTTQESNSITNNEIKYEYFTLNNNVKYVNDKIYASIQAIEIGFNVSIFYDSKQNSIEIYTLDYLELLAESNRGDIVPSTEYSYTNKRLLKYGMSIVNDSDGNIGVASYTNNEKLNSYVASCKYSNIEFNEGTKTLSVVTSNDNQKCILYLNLDSQEVVKSITSQYSDIIEIDNNFQYFLINENNKYGIINSDGKIILYPLFEQIGIDENLYTDISNKYVFADKYIPAKQNGLWGLYDINGKKLIEPQYQDIGCSIAQSGDSVVVIPNVKENVNGIVFLYNAEESLYGLYNAETGEKMAISLMEVFKKVENGSENYYMNYVIDRVNSVVHTINVRTEM